MSAPLKLPAIATRLPNSRVKINANLEIGAEVLAISVDSHFSHLAWRKTSRENGGLGQIDIPLVADITK